MTRQSAAVETLGVGLQQLHAAVGSSLKERPTVSVVLGMIEEQVLFSVNESRKASQLDEESVEQVAVAKVDELQASHLVLARRATAAAEAAAANTRRVGVLEDVARGMERRQRRTERLVDDVRNAWASVSADQETAIIRKKSRKQRRYGVANGGSEEIRKSRREIPGAAGRHRRRNRRGRELQRGRPC